MKASIRGLGLGLTAAVVLATGSGCVPVGESIESSGRAVVTGRTGGAYEPRNANRYDLENSQRFVLLDKTTEREVTCSGLQERFTDDKRLEVMANIRNRRNRRVEVQINCVFKDEQGFPTGDETPFQTLILSENAQEGVRFVSINDKARKYTIRVRQPR
ncbi:MAG: DUF1425 domain-containing protein [Verrucomicrobia bacterium]|nr:DUF1425 domain-containing protein [Verrucomicrobiota bacterium]